MVWTFGFMALRRADLGEFFAEFIRFTIFTGFFFWILTNGPSFAMSIIDSLRTIGATAAGLPRELTPSEPVSIAFDIIVKSADAYSVTSPMDNLAIFLITLLILACMTVVAANVLLVLVSAWILAFAGVFVLGFGSSRWTSDIAINYFRSVLGVALKLLTMTLLVGLAISIMDGYYAALSENAEMRELMIIFVVALALVLLIHSIPNMVASLIPGAGAASSAGSFSAGTIFGSAVGAGAAVASGGAALGGAAMSGAANAAGGASAIKAAIQKAQATASSEWEPQSFGSNTLSSGEGSAKPEQTR